MRSIFFLLLLFIFENAISQEILTDLYLFDLVYEDDSINISNGKFLNSFYATGYNNQASFFSSNLVYISSGFESNSTDILALDIKRDIFWKVTQTEEAEYSPAKIPSTDGFSVVRVEKDEKTQGLWSYPIDQSNGGKRLIPQIDNVGYYSWMDSDNLALYLVDEPNRLVLVNTITNELNILAENIGRCLKTDKNGDLYFIQFNDEKELFLKKYSAETKKLSFIAKCIGESEDFEIWRNRYIVKGNGSTLLYLDLGLNSGWQILSELNAFEIKNISRISISDDMIIIVNKK